MTRILGGATTALSWAAGVGAIFALSSCGQTYGRDALDEPDPYEPVVRADVTPDAEDWSIDDRDSGAWNGPLGDSSRSVVDSWFDEGGALGTGPAERPNMTPPKTQAWTCDYDATMNDDWHDDVLCTRGSEVDRPYLRAWDSFVSFEEIMASAAEYEAALNGE